MYLFREVRVLIIVVSKKIKRSTDSLMTNLKGYVHGIIRGRWLCHRPSYKIRTLDINRTRHSIGFYFGYVHGIIICFDRSLMGVTGFFMSLLDRARFYL